MGNFSDRRLSYRSDIDGLRALAVLLVIADHIGTRARGGYVGVDVFFVISGYLISSHILTEMSAGTFSIVDFYERRIRRIFPVLVAVLVVTAVIAYFNLIPSEIEAYIHSMLAALFSVSNLEFWHEAGYFAELSKFKPLLHTWSLGVEEQFYIFFPLMLMAVRRWIPSRLKAILWLTFALSLVAAALVAPHDPTAAFFSTPLRFWELLVGTLLSQHYFPPIQGKVQRNIATCFGLLLIVGPAFLYTQYTLFPGLTALAPCVGAALIIAAGETGTSFVASILSWRPVVFIGLISYSLYLWHWPIVAFEDTVPAFSVMSTHTARGKYTYIVVVFILATLSWRFIETPFRKGKYRPSRRTLFAMAGLSFVILTAVGLKILAMHGIPPGYPHEAVSLSKFSDHGYNSERGVGVCMFPPELNFDKFNQTTCLPQRPGHPQYLLLGDSHAGHLYQGFVAAFPNADIQEIAVGLCPPLVTEGEMLPILKVNCLKMSRFAFQTYLPGHHVDDVILSAVWTPSMLPELGRTIAWIKAHGMKPIVIGPSVQYAAPLPRLLILSIRRHDPGLVSSNLAMPFELDRQMKLLAQTEWKTTYVSAIDDLCTLSPATPSASASLSCPAYAAPGIPLLFDSNHLTSAGSVLWVQKMKADGQVP